MEQHPVPQNVTTFQFRLVGDMTLKQFGYLAGGAVAAYISYHLPLPFFFTWPLTVGFGLLGIGLAFVPIEERPMDVWIISFFRSAYSPTQFIWRQTQPTTAPAPPPEIKSSPKSAPPRTGSPGLGVVASIIEQFFAGSTDQTKIQARAPASQPVLPVPNLASNQNSSDHSQERVKQLEQKLAALEIDLKTKNEADKRILELQEQLTQLVVDRSKMEQELMRYRQQTGPTPRVMAPSKPGATVPPGQSVKVISPAGAVRAGLPRLTSFPNIITGIIKDNGNNLLPGVLVTVRDRGGVPLRALKTNKLGQFAASTPLPSGVYLIEVEDPRGRYVFDRAQITLQDALIPPIEIIAKSQKEINRANLAQQIFGQPKI